MSTVAREILEAALAGLEEKREALDRHIQAVQDLLGQKGPGRPKKAPATTAVAVAATETEAEKPASPKRVLSAAARKRIIAAQKKRWAAFRKNKAKE